MPIRRITNNRIVQIYPQNLERFTCKNQYATIVNHVVFSPSFQGPVVV